MPGNGPHKVYIPGTAKAFNDGAIASVQQIHQPQPFKRRLHRRIIARINLRRTVAMCPVPSIDLAQFGGELLGRRGLFQGRVALAIAEDHQADRVRPSPEIGRILRRIDLRPAVIIAAEPEIVGVAIAGAEFAGDFHAA